MSGVVLLRLRLLRVLLGELPGSVGLPAICLVAAAILGRSPENHSSSDAWLSRLGNASFALYLVHPFVMRAMDLLSRHIHLFGDAILYVPISLVIAQITALAIHEWLERRTTVVIRSRLEAFA